MLSPDVARFRAATLRALRGFFDERGYLEADVPAMAPALIPEAHIEVFRTELVNPYGDPPEPRFLLPSPELPLKRLLSQGYGDLYYLGKSYRNAESTSPLHRPEFTMLEWYTVDADYRSQAGLTAELLEHLCTVLPHGEGCSALSAPPEHLTVAAALARHAGTPPNLFDAPDALRDAARKLGLSVGLDESEEDIYQRILLTSVEPALPRDRPVFLTDYPALVPTLARRRGTSVERWELYLAGMEIANCYTEERDRDAIERFLDEEGERKADALVPHPTAETFLEFAGAPPCSGVALGVDRLVMAMLGLKDIGGVIFSP
ncbi:MAG: amino acid--tRNA ligase-related protein [Spirochaetota bacterium]